MPTAHASRPSILLATGSNGTAQLGIGHTDDVCAFTPCVFLDGDGRAIPREDTPLERGWSVRDLRSGAGHSLLLLERGEAGAGQQTGNDTTVETELWTCGSNEYGQLGPRAPRLSTGWRRIDVQGLVEACPALAGARYASLAAESRWAVKAIACAWTTSFVVLERSQPPKSDGPPSSDVILSFGTNDMHELGVGNVGPDRARGVHRIKMPARLDKRSFSVDSITAGQRHVVAVLESGPRSSTQVPSQQVVLGWGAARHDQLATAAASKEDGARAEGSSSTRSPAASRSPIRGKQPRLPIGCKTASKYPATMHTPTVIDLSTLLGQLSPGAINARVQAVYAGSAHTLFHLEDGSAIAFGSKAKRQTEGVTPSAGQWSAAGATWNGCYLAAGTAVHSTGSNTHGQLGRSEGNYKSGPQPVDLRLRPGQAVTRMTCGSEHVIVLVDGGKQVLVWGWNEHGNLGLGDQRDRAVPTRLNLADGWSARGCWAGCGTSWITLAVIED